MMKKLILIYIVLLSINSIYAQKGKERAVNINEPINEHLDNIKYSPNGYFDNVYDRFGNKYSLSEIKIDKTNNKVLRWTDPTCDTGIFRIHYTQGSGMMPGDTDAEARRNVICKVFKDLSDFIISPLHNSNTKVEIWIRDINGLGLPSNVLGGATGFYSIPFISNPHNGIIDNEIWKTINTGVDSFANLVFPLSTQSDVITQTGVFYHGMMTFNFSADIWHTDVSTPCPAGKYDFYSTVLHEATHQLGFASLIDAVGESQLITSGGKYFSRYDTFLKSPNNESLISPLHSNCSHYNNNFELNTSVINPNCSSNPPANTTNCLHAVKFVGSNTIPVYTPQCYQQGSSLSHFEDSCYLNYSNDQYFLMCNQSTLGLTKRIITTEERTALCDIGYKINATFGSNTNHNYINYGNGVCNSNRVLGITDGVNTNGGYINITPINTTINISNVLLNDISKNNISEINNIQDLRFECLQDLTDPSANIITSGNTSTATITFQSSVVGVHLLRYVPYSQSNGKRGNITYLYVYVTNNCATINDMCNLVFNGNFEENSGIPLLHEINKFCGWMQIFPTYAYHQNSSTVNQNSIPCNIAGFQFSNNNLGLAYAGFENNQLDLNGYNYAPHILVGELKTPLLPNSKYRFSIDVSKADSSFFKNGTFQIGLHKGLNLSVFSVLNNTPNYDIVLTPISNNLSTENWQTLTFEFQADNVGGQKYIYIGNFMHTPEITTINGNPPYNNGCNYTVIQQQVEGSIFYVDNIKLESIDNATLNFPINICIGSSINNLDTYIINAPSNGIFSVNGNVISNNTFNTSQAGIGYHTIVYTYTNSTNCIKTVTHQIEVNECNNCPANYVFTTPEPATNPTTYHASSNISTLTNYIVSTTTPTITFLAGNSITLSPLTEIKVSSSSNFTAKIEECNSIESNEKLKKNAEIIYEENEKINLFPNPTNDIITVSIQKSELKKITLFSIDGKMIYNQEIEKSNSYKLNLSNYQKGIYLAIIETYKGNIYQEKIVKN